MNKYQNKEFQRIISPITSDERFQKLKDITSWYN